MNSARHLVVYLESLSARFQKKTKWEFLRLSTAYLGKWPELSINQSIASHPCNLKALYWAACTLQAL